MKILRRWLGHIQLSETIILWILAAGVGLATAVGVWIFKQLIELTHLVEYSWLGGFLAHFGSWTLIFLPVLGGLIVGLLVHFIIGEERYYNVAGVIEAVALSGGRLRYKKGPAKMLAAALSIGSGASVGPEDPSVQIGSYLGSMISQLLRFSDERMRALVAAGAASGIAAAFNAPIAGVFFALEIILGEISGSAFGVVMLASVVSAVFTQIVSGTQPAFHIPPYVYRINWQIPLYMVLGLLAGPLAASYTRLLYLSQDFFARLNRLPRWIKPALAGLILGVIGLFLPQILGIGYDTISNILDGSLAATSLLLGLTLAKLILTPTSIGSGFLGGVIAPSMFIGAGLGGAFGQVASRIFPSLAINPPTVAMVGMAAVLAAAIHAPLTAIILLFEMTNDYHIILPAMLAVVVSLVVSQRLERDSVYSLGLARNGIRLERGRDVEILETVYVSEVMQSAPFTLNETDTLTQASEYFIQTHHHGAPVLNSQGELVGIFTLRDLDATQADNWAYLRVGEMCTQDLVVAYPDETIGVALRKMGQRDIGRIPVVPRDNTRQLLGILRRADMVRAYDAALTRRAAMRHRVHQIQLGAINTIEMRVKELAIEPGSVCANKHVSEVFWPHDCIVASLRR
ncbi:MAG: chloride channel protein, partial [Acidobacteriaceae bacterium]